MRYFEEEWRSLLNDVGSAKISRREPWKLRASDFVPARGLGEYLDRVEPYDSMNGPAERLIPIIKRNALIMIGYHSSLALLGIMVPPKPK